MPDLILRVSLSDEEAALYQGRDAMVVPMSVAETAELRGHVIAVHELLAALGAAQVSDQATGELADFLRQARTRELLGRAAFVGPEGGKGKAVLQ